MTPKIRFSGYDEPYKAEPLSAFMQRIMRKNTHQETDIPLTISSQDGLVDQRTYFGKKVASADMSGYYLLNRGEFAYNKSTSIGFPFGSIKQLDKYESGAVSTLYICFALKGNKCDSEYIKHYFDAQKWNKEVAMICAEGSRNHGLLNIPVDDFFDTLHYIPESLSEQQKIAAFLSAYDKKISLQKERVETLREQKRGLLQKMFPKKGETVPELRFPGFTDDWEQRKLGDVATFINGRAYSQPELLSSGKYKVLRVGNFYTNDSWYYSDLELGEKYYADYGDLLYTWSATFGPHIWLGDRVIYHYHIWKIDLSNQLEKQFAVQLLEQDKANILSSKNGSTMVHITKEGMEQKDVIIPPSTKEQQEIGAFFQQLDNLITLHQRKLETMQEIKKGLLQQMFC